MEKSIIEFQILTKYRNHESANCKKDSQAYLAIYTLYWQLIFILGADPCCERYGDKNTANALSMIQESNFCGTLQSNTLTHYSDLTDS